MEAEVYLITVTRTVERFCNRALDDGFSKTTVDWLIMLTFSRRRWWWWWGGGPVDRHPAPFCYKAAAPVPAIIHLVTLNYQQPTISFIQLNLHNEHFKKILVQIITFLSLLSAEFTPLLCPPSPAVTGRLFRSKSILPMITPHVPYLSCGVKVRNWDYERMNTSL